MADKSRPVPPPPPPRPSIAVRDVRALRALAHPLRTRLLGLLRLDGPSTATLLAARVGESSGSTSYHLRQLAAYGFVEEMPAHGTGRERWWRAAHRSTHWEDTDFLDDPGGREIVAELRERQLRHHCRLLLAAGEQHDSFGREWAAATTFSDHAVRLPPARAAALARELNDVLTRWIATTPDPDAPGAELVSVLVDVFPLREYPQ